MKKLYLYLGIFVTFTIVSCNKSVEKTDSINNNYEQYSLANYKITIDKTSGLMMIDLDNNGKFIGEFKSNNIDADANGKLVCPKGMSMYFIPFDNNPTALRMMEPTYVCDCPDDPSPNDCDYYDDSEGRLRCGGSSDCCEGYIEDLKMSDEKNKIEKNKYTNGIIVACNSLILQGKQLN